MWKDISAQRSLVIVLNGWSGLEEHKYKKKLNFELEIANNFARWESQDLDLKVCKTSGT